MFVRFDYVASHIVNANHGIVRAAVENCRPPRQRGVRGGCSPKKNVDSPSHTPVAQGDHHLHLTKKVSNTDASQFAQETPACVGLAVSNLFTFLYRPDTLSVVQNASGTWTPG